MAKKMKSAKDVQLGEVIIVREVEYPVREITKDEATGLIHFWYGKTKRFLISAQPENGLVFLK